MLTKMISVSVMLMVLVVGLSKSEPRLKYGASCRSEDWCDYGKWLWCHETRCQCLHPKRQVFDLAHNRCVAQVGTECNVYIGDRDCTSNSFCDWHDGKGLCKCKTGFVVTGQRTCASIRGGQYDSIPVNLASENEIIDSTPGKFFAQTEESPYYISPAFIYNSSRRARPTATDFGSGYIFNNANQNAAVQDEDRSNDLMSSWRRFMTLLYANRNTGIFFR